MRLSIIAAVSGAALCISAGVSSPAFAEVIEEKDSGFVTKDEAVVSATPKETWLALISPSDWWSSAHTWSADAGNLRMTPQAGGCFCEKIPEVVTEDSFTLEGSVEHMRVIQAYPERALRMVGALGPLQSEPVTGVLTIVLTEVELPGQFGAKGTRIVWEYNVGGSMRYEVPVISRAVDVVMSLQLAGLADKLGLVEMPEDEKPDAEEETPKGDDTEGEGAEASKDDADKADEAPAEGDEKAEIKAEDTLEEGDAEPEKPKAKGPSVDEAFGDLADPDPAEEEPPAEKDGDPDQ